MSKNVAVFVDVANIFYAAKAAGVDIDYVTLLKSATAGRDLVRAYAYTGLDPENENQRNFHDFLRRHGYRVVSKDIRKYGDGKVKANLDIELVVDMMKTARNLDIAIVVSGDGDFAPAIRAVQEQGVRVEVISFRGNTSSDLIEVADQFTDITSLAKVERDSTRSGRRIADDEHDLSMTEVPDKLTEGSGSARGRGGRTRGRGRGTEAPAASRRGRATEPAPAAVGVSEAAGGREAASGGLGAGMVVLPGEKLSRVSTSLAPTGDAALTAAADVDEDLEDEGALAAFGPERAGAATAGGMGAGRPSDGAAGEGGRRRRRRGGRGRGRGRGDAEAGEFAAPGTDDTERAGSAYVPRAGGSNAFGSVWDSQIGTPSQRTLPSPSSDDEDFEEPEIPEYLIAERRQRAAGGRGGRGGGRGGGRQGAYASFVERERYGRGGGGGINRYPDVSGRERSPREPLPPRLDRPRVGSGDAAEPWSEVPPELEALLRAQLAAKPRDKAPAAPAGPRTGGAPGGNGGSPIDSGAAAGAPPDGVAATPTRRRRATAAAADSTGAQASEHPAATAAEPKTGGRGRARRPAAPSDGELSSGPAEPGSATPRRRGRATAAAGATDGDGTSEVPAAEAAPATTTRRRRTSATRGGDSDPVAATAAEAGKATAARDSASSEGEAEAKPAPRRRTTRKTTESNEA